MADFAAPDPAKPATLRVCELVRRLLYLKDMQDSSTVSGEIDTRKPSASDAVRLPLRLDDTTLVRPRAWPRATRDLTNDIPRDPPDSEQMRGMIWFAAGGLLIAVGLYLVF